MTDKELVEKLYTEANISVDDLLNLIDLLEKLDLIKVSCSEAVMEALFLLPSYVM